MSQVKSQRGKERKGLRFRFEKVHEPKTVQAQYLNPTSPVKRNKSCSVSQHTKWPFSQPEPDVAPTGFPLPLQKKNPKTNIAKLSTVQ